MMEVGDECGCVRWCVCARFRFRLVIEENERTKSFSVFVSSVQQQYFFRNQEREWKEWSTFRYRITLLRSSSNPILSGNVVISFGSKRLCTTNIWGRTNSNTVVSPYHGIESRRTKRRRMTVDPTRVGTPLYPKVSTPPSCVRSILWHNCMDTAQQFQRYNVYKYIN